MRRLMLKSKIHRATITGTALDYEGSITIDEGLLEEADILPGEQVHVLNLNSGARFITYAIVAPRGSGTVLLNGPAARLGSIGDKVIVLSYCETSDEDAQELKPKVVLVGPNNRSQQE
ncbi:MAG: aspartate 1-decarboxylase [Deltaproteobacteria bacterium]|nr:aspartate 1-decarboxylase [Deltaproteobacteria bacterium]